MAPIWQGRLIPALTTATILGIGATVVWTLWVRVAAPLLGPAMSMRLGLPDNSLSPALLLVSLFFALCSEPHYLDAFFASLGRMWVSFAVLGVISSALAITCYIHHRRYSRVAAAAWSVYVLVMGVPGAIGYWLHRRWPPAVRCPRCELPSPCDREECLHCGASFPLPAANGTEILQPQLVAPGQ